MVRPRRQAAALGLVVAACIAARIYLAAVQGTDARTGWRPPENPLQLASLLAMSGLLAAGTTLLSLRFFNKTSAVLAAVALGGLTTAAFNGLIGAMPGGFIGLLIVSHLARRVALVCLLTVSAFGLGIAAGTLALWCDPDLSDGPSVGSWLVFALLPVVASPVVFWRRTAGSTLFRHALRRSARFCLLILIVTGSWLSLSVDMARRVWSLSAEKRYVGDNEIKVRPLSLKWFWPGPLFVEQLEVRADACDDDLRALRGWTTLTYLNIRSPQITDGGLAHLERLASLSVLGLESPKITDRGVNSLAALVKLQALSLHKSQVTAVGIEALSSIRGLADLDLHDTAVSDDDLASLQAFAALSWLSLEGTSITDDGMLSISSINSLRTLDLSRTEVRGPGLAYLKNTKLSTLSLSGTAVSDDDLDLLTDLPMLSSLTLDGTRITDTGLVKLQRIPGLRALSLRNTAITDASVPHLKSLTALTFVDVGGTRITREGAKSLKETTQNGIFKFNVVRDDVSD